MKHFIIILFLFVTHLKLQAQLNLVPWPNQVEISGEAWTLPGEVAVTGSDLFTDAREALNEIFTGYNLPLHFSSDSKKATILFIKESPVTGQSEEAYQLTTDNQIIIKASTTKGAFYAVKTLKQLLSKSNAGQSISVPSVRITDAPAFSWRAFMLDEARYFKGMQVVKKLLDDMADLKMNIFHWHLTDDQGWRLAISKYPLLTTVGGKRSNSQVGGWESKSFSGQPHEGFYTQQQVKEIVAYAAKRQISIVPEIEMPGHSAAAIAAYPWLGAYTDSSIAVPTVFGKRPEALDVSNKKVVRFYEDVLLEVMELFPSGIIHIGGDEVNFTQWKSSRNIQAYMKTNKLATPADLQIHFTNRISQFILSKKRRMMGWNDILGGNVLDWQGEGHMKVSEQLAPNTIIHFWKGDEALMLSALSKGFTLVNSNEQYTYIDYPEDVTSLQKAYDFNPVPASLPAKQQDQILGLGCQMWGEWIPDVASMNRRIYPRIAAYAETGWTRKQNKEFERFKNNLEASRMFGSINMK